MSQPSILIKDLVKGNQVWKMHIRVADLWVVNEKNGQQHLEFVIHDGKVCPNQLKIVFNDGTTITSIAIPYIPPHQFYFKPIQTFLNGNFQSDMLYDVIGVLQDVLKTQMGGGGRKSYANITLRDEAENVIEVALWDDYGK